MTLSHLPKHTQAQGFGLLYLVAAFVLAGMIPLIFLYRKPKN